MIREVTLRRFKRFREQVFRLDGHVVLAGPNNAGKTTLLQAIAAWQLALNRWKEVGERHRRGGGYPWAHIARQAFYAVPLRSFGWLWHQRDYEGSIEIEVKAGTGWTVRMELKADSTEQIKVRPAADCEPWMIETANVRATFVPPMTGLSLEEPVYQKPKVEQLLGMGRPGEVIRNLLLEASESPVWPELTETIRRLFGLELLRPDGSGADIVAEYRASSDGPSFDIGSAGSGFQQVLMLLTFLHVRPASVLLLDEPDAHLHVILQDAIYGELRSVAARHGSQLIVATHSEVIINAVAPEELCMLYGKPRRLVDTTERTRLARSLGLLSQTDVLLALDAKGILYLEGRTDLELLREWARVLRHPVYDWLGTRPFWKPTVWEARPGASGIPAQRHYDALKLVRDDLPALILLDGDARRQPGDSPITGEGLQRIAWRRYEAESYLAHPAALERFVQLRFPNGLPQGRPSLAREAWVSLFGSLELADLFAANPHSPPAIIENYFITTKARTDILPALFHETGVHGFEYTRFSEIAAQMHPEEIHPEVIEKLDAIKIALRL